MTEEHQYIAVAIRLHRASQQQRRGAAEAAFRYASRNGIDELWLQPAFIQTPPANIAQAVNEWIRKGRRHKRWLIVERPSSDQINLALSASLFLESVNLVKERRALVTISDAAENLSLEISRIEWNRLRGELEEVLGGDVEYDLAELASNN